MTDRYPESVRRDAGYYRAAYKWFSAIDDGEKPLSYYAKRFNVAPKTIRRWRELGRSGRYRIGSPEQFEHARSLLESGMTYAAAARETGVTRSSLQYRFPGFGKNYRDRGKTVWDRVEAMVEDGCSASEIARTIGVDKGAILTRFPNSSWTNSQGAKFNADIRNIRKRMPKYIDRVIFSSYAGSSFDN